MNKKNHITIVIVVIILENRSTEDAEGAKQVGVGSGQLFGPTVLESSPLPPSSTHPHILLPCSRCPSSFLSEAGRNGKGIDRERGTGEVLLNQSPSNMIGISWLAGLNGSALAGWSAACLHFGHGNAASSARPVPGSRDLASLLHTAH